MLQDLSLGRSNVPFEDTAIQKRKDSHESKLVWGVSWIAFLFCWKASKFCVQAVVRLAKNQRSILRKSQNGIIAVYFNGGLSCGQKAMIIFYSLWMTVRKNMERSERMFCLQSEGESYYERVEIILLFLQERPFHIRVQSSWQITENKD